MIIPLLPLLCWRYILTLNSGLVSGGQVLTDPSLRDQRVGLTAASCSYQFTHIDVPQSIGQRPKWSKAETNYMMESLWMAYIPDKSTSGVGI